MHSVTGISFAGFSLSPAGRGHTSIVRMLLEWPDHPAQADCSNGEALVEAARGGHTDVLALLLARWPVATAMPCACEAMIRAAEGGHVDAVRVLLGCSELHAPHADCLAGEALVRAASRGHTGVVELLLGYPRHAPRADCRGGEVLERAEVGGHADVLRLLHQRQVQQLQPGRQWRRQ